MQNGEQQKPGGRGALFVVSTPIGNLEDLTERAKRTLEEVDLVAAEDTRETLKLIRHYGIQTRCESYHAYNQAEKTPQLVRFMASGGRVALVSDAGTPGISDPGYRLICDAIEAKIPVIPIPGPSAVITALVVSGMPTHRFVFEGFLPVKKGRKKRLLELKEEPRTIILYESPHRLLRTLKEILTLWGDRPMAACREMTKKFEEIVRGSVSEVLAYYHEKKVRGEFVLVIHGKTT